MPLAELLDGKHYAAKFVDVTAAPSELLHLDDRIATLSDRGIYVLQQRIVKHYTRFEIDIPSLAKGDRTRPLGNASATGLGGNSSR